MLPFKVQNYIKKDKDEDRKKAKLSCSRQALANQMVLGTMPQQAPANATAGTPQPAK